MARLLVDLEQIERFYGDEDSRKEILRHCLALETAGFDGVVMNVTGGFDPARARILEILRQTVNIGLTVSIPVDERWIESLQEIKPSLVLFDYKEEQSERLSSFITRLQIEDILIGFQVSDDLEIIKKVARLKADYLVFRCDSYCRAESLNREVEELNKIVKLASLASKLSMGVIARGEFDRRKMKRLNDTGVMEEFILGLNLISEALLFGYETAAEKIRSALT
jgi:pyridoxine 5'-phosphate synthase PdxJ